MKIRISAPYSFQGIGSKDKQEDTLYPLMGEASPLNRVFMVCDGMGGHEKGEVASYCVASTIGKYVEDSNSNWFFLQRSEINILISFLCI